VLVLVLGRLGLGTRRRLGGRQEIELVAARQGQQRGRLGVLLGFEVDEVGRREIVVGLGRGGLRGLFPCQHFECGFGCLGRCDWCDWHGGCNRRGRGRGLEERQVGQVRQFLRRQRCGHRHGYGRGRFGSNVARGNRQRFRIGQAHRRGHGLAGQQGLGHAVERCGLPSMRRAGGDGFDPFAEFAQRAVGTRQQFGRGVALVGQPGVEHLLHRPGGIAEVGQADHARAALERVERAAQDGEFFGVVRMAAEFRDGGQAVLDHFAGLVEEDVLQVVFFELGHLGVGQRARAGDLRGPAFGLAAELLDGRHLGLAAGRGERGELGGDLRVDFLDAEHRFGHGCLLALRGAIVGHAVGGLAAHERLEFTGFGVEHEQALGQCGLVAQHVDQEAQRAQVVAQRVEAGHFFGRRGADQHGLDVVAHALHGVRGLFEAEHGEHAAHLHQLRRHGAQQALFGGAAEVLVERFFEFAQVAAQLVDHGAHGLAIAHAAVQVFHPRLERLGMATGAHAFDAAGQLQGAGRELRVARVEVFERGFEVQHRGGDFHRELGVGRLAAAHGGFNGMGQGLHHRQARRMQLLQRLAQLREGVGHLARAGDVAARKRRPHFLGGLDALARLCEHQRIEAAELLDGVVDVRFAGDAPGAAHGAQRGGVVARGGHALRTEEQQVLAKSVGHHAVAARERGVLQQHPRGGALHVGVGGNEVQREGVEEARGQGPEAGDAGQQRAASEAQAQGMQAPCGLRVAGLDQLQHFAVEPRSHGGVIGNGRLRERGLDLDPAPSGAPEVGRVHALVADQFQHVAVLRKQRHRRHRLAGQQGIEKIGDGEAGTLDLVHGTVGAALRIGDEALHRELDGAEHQRGRGMPHHLQSANGLVQLLAGHLQRAALGLGGRANVAHVTPQRLAYTVEGFLDFSQHPGQRPKVFGGRRSAGEGGRGRGLNRHVGCSPFLSFVRQS
jgi:hypothetical protein